MALAWAVSGCASAHAAPWKLDASQTLPSPADGMTHHVQSISGALDPSAPFTHATLHFVRFDAHRDTLRFFDQGALGRERLGDVMQKNHCLAGTNGGYFQPDFEPVGLLLADGRLVRRPERARLLSGALVVTRHHIRLRRSSEPLPGRDARQALQSGPFLVDGGKAVAGLNNGRSARRTAILTDGDSEWALVSTSALTLEELGAILAMPELLPAGLRADCALNLDGGSSTGLWVQQPGTAAYSLPEFGIVRDFIGIVPR